MTCFASSWSFKPSPLDPPRPLRDLFWTGFGRGFLSLSCPTLATTPVPSTPSAKPRPARKSFLLRRHPCPPILRNEPNSPSAFSAALRFSHLSRITERTHHPRPSAFICGSLPPFNPPARTSPST